MQPSVRSLDQILAELGTVYQPQIDSIRQRQSLIPGQIAEEEKGLQAKQENAFGEIVNGARRRGLGFAGIPLGEQAKYTATEFLPSLSRLRQSGREQAMNLEDAILGIQERRQGAALQQQQYEQQRYDQYQQFQQQLAEQRRQETRAASNQFRPTTSTRTASTPSSTASLDPIQQSAYSEVRNMVDSNDGARIFREYEAIKQSAGYGNAKDKVKLQLIAQLYPWIAQRSGSNSVPITPNTPNLISLNRPGGGGLSVGVANPGSIQVR